MKSGKTHFDAGIQASGQKPKRNHLRKPPDPGFEYPHFKIPEIQFSDHMGARY
jgi:hypothetical protein